MDRMKVKTLRGRRLSVSELGYQGDEQIVKDMAHELGIRQFAAWRRQQFERAKVIVAIPHVAQALRLVSEKLELERLFHAEKLGNGRVAAKYVRWLLRATKAERVQ